MWSKFIARRWPTCLCRPDDMDGMVHILKLREVYRHLSNAADRVDEAASHLSDMAVKMG
jgi:uncharacterized protein Yka (UPF0111/DUF47 family)